MAEVPELRSSPQYKATMERLKTVMRVSPRGVDYWLAREICPILGYTWEGFEGALTRAMNACDGIGVSAHDHFRQTSAMVKLGSGALRKVQDYFLTRTACYLVAMNGESTKPEIAAAQAYFTVQTRRMELTDERNEDERRLEMRDRVSASFRKVSGVAKKAGVKNQAFFHDARYKGLYGMSSRKVKEKKGLGADEQLFDRAGALELSANDFQMNLAANVLSRDEVRGETKAINVNRDVGERVRGVINESGGTLPEDLPLEPPITEVKKRLKARRQLPPKP